MKLQIAFSILFCLFGLTLSSQTAAASQEGPVTVISFEEDTYEFGTVLEGEHVTKVFTFTNTGEEPLVISSARGSCGCTVPKCPREPILPGETASITVNFDTRAKLGRHAKKVTITANTNPAQTFLYIKGEVLTPDGRSTESPENEGDEITVQPDCFVIAPNPAAEVLNLKMDGSRIGKPVTVSIFSATGQLMAQRHIPEAPGKIEFEVSHYPAGIYVAKVQTEEGAVNTQCFVVSR